MTKISFLLITRDKDSSIANTLIALRKKTGLTQKQLARMLGINWQQIQRYEANNYKGVSLKRVEEILNCLGAKIVLNIDIV